MQLLPLQIIFQHIITFYLNKKGNLGKKVKKCNTHMNICHSSFVAYKTKIKSPKIRSFKKYNETTMKRISTLMLDKILNVAKIEKQFTVI